MTGFLVEKASPASIEKALTIGARLFLPRADGVTPELVAAGHDKELRVVTWTANETEEMRSLIEARVDGIITNYPDRLNAALSE